MATMGTFQETEGKPISIHFKMNSCRVVVHLVPVNPSPNIHKQILQTDLYTFL